MNTLSDEQDMKFQWSVNGRSKPLWDGEYSLAKKGTFEWAMIQLKRGYNITRNHDTWMKCGFGKEDDDVCIDMVDFLAEDWEISK